MIHLHLHSHYSTLDGLGKIPEIVSRAKEIQASAVAVTDHASISSLPDLFKEAKAAEIRPLIGCEFYLGDAPEGVKEEKRRHLTVIAKSWTGVRSIMNRLTLANEQFYRRPRLTFDQALGFEDCVVMTACSFGVLSYPDYLDRVARLQAAYGANLYLEAMPLSFADQRETNRRAVECRLKLGVPLVATNDAHFVRAEDAVTHEVLIAIQYGQAWTDPDRKSFGDEIYMRDVRDMAESFLRTSPEVPRELVREAILNTARVASVCDVQMPVMPVELPSPDPSEEDEAAFGRFLKEGFQEKFAGKAIDMKVYSARLAEEVGVIRSLGFMRYFLIVKDIIRWAREQDIMVGPARGSSCGSLVCYLLDITQVDPIPHELYFSRFLNAERVDLPDIDVDFEDSRRQEVFAYVRAKYGHDYTANINTFGYLKPKNCFKDVARVFGVSPIQSNSLSKLIEDVESFDNEAELVRFAQANPHIIEQTKKLIGTIRQNGVHAAGIVVSSRPLKEVCAIERRKNGVEVTCWDKRASEKFGLLKIDVLGLSNLTMLNDARKLVKANRGVDIDFTKIPLEDPEVMAAFARGETVGVFQFENQGMAKLLRDIKASDFETIVAANALYRPGSLESGETARYAKIAKGDEYERYDDERLKPILGATRSVLVYQEQIMRIANELAGFSWPEADTLRKIIGKKLGTEEFEKHRARFVEGCVKNGVTSDAANTIFSKMVEFSGYAFNKSHSCCYSYISVWTMWMKRYYPLEYLAAVLSSTEDERKKVIVGEAKRLGIAVRLPDVNASLGGKFACLPEDNAIVAPLDSIKGVGGAAVAAILAARGEGVFLSLQDFESRVDKRSCNSRVREALIKAGAFESLGTGESDPDIRAKHFAELLPFFIELPSLDLKAGAKIDKAAYLALVQRMAECGAAQKMTPMTPILKKLSAPLMIVNANQSNEKAHLTADGTRFLVSELKGRGIREQDFYYTSPMKCFHGKGKPSKACEAKCLDSLREEIRLVRPKAILCCASSMLQFFGADKKANMGKMLGKVIYHKEFDAYIVFSYSPQYAFFKEEVIGQFRESLDLVAEMFGAGEER